MNLSKRANNTKAVLLILPTEKMLEHCSMFVDKVVGMAGEK